MDFSFKKVERLHKKKELELLFKKGTSFYLHPFKVIHLADSFENESTPLKLAISVPKRKFKKAVDRNRLKRQIREAYRLNRNPLKEQIEKLDKKLVFILIYSIDKKLDYKEIEDKIILTLQRLQLIYAENSQ